MELKEKKGMFPYCLLNRTHQLLTCSKCSSPEVFCFVLTTKYYRHSDGVLCSFLQITKCIDHHSDRRYSVRVNETLSVVDV